MGGGEAYFTATLNSYVYGLWKSNGTAAGTLMVDTVEMPDVRSNLVSAPEGVFFSAQESSAGRELWRSDGTAPGTSRIKDIRPARLRPTPTDITVDRGRVFFAADDGVNGAELWTTDGTEAGTSLVYDVRPGAASSSAPTRPQRQLDAQLSEDHWCYEDEHCRKPPVAFGLSDVPDILKAYELTLPADFDLPHLGVLSE